MGQQARVGPSHEKAVPYLPPLRETAQSEYCVPAGTVDCDQWWERGKSGWDVVASRQVFGSGSLRTGHPSEVGSFLPVNRMVRVSIIGLRYNQS